VRCDPDASEEKVHTRMDLLTVVRLQSATGRGLFQELETSLQHLGIQKLSIEHGCTRLLYIGTDGAAHHLAASGFKGLVV
jgi:hypothetical protein